MRHVLALSSLALLVAACAPTPAETARAIEAQQATADRLAQALAGLTPGRTDSCLPLVRPDVHTETYGRTILYKVNRKLIYRNDTSGGCEGGGSGHDDILVSVEHQGRPCSGDIVRTVDRYAHFPTGSCALGDFVEYRKR